MIPPKLIAEYFYEFKKVSFEGIGTLERKHKSAKADVADKVFVPPTAYIEFSPEVSNSDAFIKYISVTQNLTQKEAELKIQQFVTQLKAVLESKNEYPLDKLGRFLYNKNTKQITFQQNPDAFADSPFYYGLGEAHFLPVSRSTLTGSEKNETPKEEIHKVGSNFSKNSNTVAKITAQELKKSLEVIEKKEEQEKTEKKSSKKMLIIGISTGLISLFIILVFGLSYFFPSLDALHVYHKKHDSLKSKNNTTHQDSVQHQTHKDTLQHENNTKVQEEVHNNTTTSNAPTNSSIVNEATGNTGSYYIIVASFINPDIANQHLNTWRSKGFDAHITTSHQGNKYRLYIHQSDKEQDALNSLEEFKSKTGKSDLWILYQ